ncbi:MAG: ketoacyl-ACP synthase III [Tissierellia bacterium]|nr:ketoacyl-ACP synthase III [Tissierellia bacterium]
MGLKIIDCKSYIPEKSVSNQYFEDILDTSEEWILQRTGIETRYFSNIDVSEMVKKVVRSLHLGNKKQKIKFIAASSVTPDYIIPSISAIAHKALDLEEDVFSLDLNMACTGFVGGLILGERMLEPGECGIIIGAERLSERINFKDRSTAMLFGDGAAVVLVEKTTDSFPIVQGTVPSKDLELMANDKSKIVMEGKNIYKFATSTLPRALTLLLEKAKLEMEDIDYVIFHQANKRIIDSVGKKVGGREKFYTNLETLGNTSSASIGLCLAEMKEKNYFSKGEKLIILGFGGGLTYAGTILEWNGL